jgi:hypothetical protein
MTFPNFSPAAPDLKTPVPKPFIAIQGFFLALPGRQKAFDCLKKDNPQIPANEPPFPSNRIIKFP